MDKVIGLGKLGCAIAEELTAYPEYRIYKIDAEIVVYPGTIDQGGRERRVVAVEHEHRLGVSGIKLIPLHLENGNAQFGNPLSQKKPFKIFYDE